MEAKSFAAALREAMGSLTQEQVAQATGISQAAISRYLRGAEPRLSQLAALEKALPRLRRLRNAA
jgi:predicted transcriptional regulator